MQIAPHSAGHSALAILAMEFTMRCANPDCNLMSHDLTTGSLRLLELDVPPEERVTRSDWGFPICCVPSRYFWLCQQCCGLLSIRRWTKEGLVLEYRMDRQMERRTGRKDVREIRMSGGRAGRGPHLVIEKTA